MLPEHLRLRRYFSEITLKLREEGKIMSEVSAFVLVGLVTEEGEKNWSENLVWI